MIRMYKLHDHLYVRPHTRHVDTERMLHTLQDHRICLVLNVALINDPFLAAGCRTIGIVYEHEPLNDSQNLDPERVHAISWRVVEYLRSGNAVLIHCDSGWSRSGLIAMLALQKFTKRPAEELIAEARAIRGENFLKNWTFEHFVLSQDCCMDCAVNGEPTH